MVRKMLMLLLSLLWNLPALALGDVPHVVSTSPDQNELNVVVSTNISVTFDVDMDSATINDSTFVVNARSTGLHQGTITYDSLTKTATFDPNSDFDVGEAVTVVLTKGLRSLAGVPLDSIWVWSFTTSVSDESPGTFGVHLVYAVGDWPRSVFGADLNGDGDIDLVTANANDEQVSVLMNNGDTSFAAHSTYWTRENPYSVFAADLDKDGDLDLVTANSGADQVCVLLNDGSGSFAADSVYPVGDVVNWAIAADLDGDGNIDLATANRYSDNVSILLNNGDATFLPQSTYAVGDEPWCVFAADLDGDGDLDLAVANSSSRNVSVLLNNGDATFASDVVYSVAGSAQSILADDFDGDGDADLAAGCIDTGHVSVLLNNGDGTFQAHSSYPVGSRNPSSIFAADFNGDGDLDLATGIEGGLKVSILSNYGDGTFGDLVKYEVGLGHQSLFAADFDGDGDLDLAVAHAMNGGSDTVSVLLNRSILRADFSAVPTVGHIPLVVQFTDLSAGGGGPTLWFWDFGDDSTSAAQHPVHTYHDTGYFDVTLIASNESNSDTAIKQNYIHVAPITADFSAEPESGLVPLNVQFTDLSEGDPTSWLWDFGDDSVSTDQHPAHTYSQTGYFDVKLIVSNALGTDSLLREDYIHATEEGACFLSYTDWYPVGYWEYWRLGDKVAIYMDPGDCGNPENYPLQLTEVEFFLYDHQAVESVSVRFSVEEAQPSLCDGPGSELWESQVYSITTFYPDRARIDLPNGVCVNEPFFFSVEYMSDQPEGTMPTLVWDSLQVDICYQWVWRGGQEWWVEWYDFWGVPLGWVTLRISGYTGNYADCSLHPDFSSDPDSGLPPLSVQFTDSSAGAPTSWLWHFGDGDSSMQQHPAYVYSCDDTGYFDVRLIVSNQAETDTLVKDSCIYVSPGIAAVFTADQTWGGVPLTVQFIDLSLGCPVSWLWDFGDDSASTDQFPVHTYNDTGYYDVKLVVSNAQGTDSLIKEDYIQVTRICSEDTLDRGACDTLNVVCLDCEAETAVRDGLLVRFALLVTHDQEDEIDSIASFVIPLTWTHTNPAAYCSLGYYWNAISVLPSYPDFERSIFRHIVEGVDTIYHNRMADMAADLSGREWDTRILELSSHPDSAYIRMALLPTGTADQYWWEGERVLLATLTFKLEDTMHVCIDTTFWPPGSNLAFTRSDAAIYTPRDNLPHCFSIASSGVDGDVNSDGVVNVGDVVFLINYLFRHGSPPIPLDAGDVECSGTINVGDVVYLINYLYRGGDPPPHCE